jgi:hypothetical protein
MVRRSKRQANECFAVIDSDGEAVIKINHTLIRAKTEKPPKGVIAMATNRIPHLEVGKKGG